MPYMLTAEQPLPRIQTVTHKMHDMVIQLIMAGVN